MIIKKRLSLWIVFCFLCLFVNTGQVFAQATPVTISLPAVAAKKGDTLNLPIRVKNFKKVTTTQFSLHWDANVLDFIKSNQYALNIKDADHFNFANVTNGELIFAWYDGTTKGVNLPDSSVLFNLKYFYKGENNVKTAITFDSIPLLLEVAIAGKDINYVYIPGVDYLFKSGTINVPTVATTEIENNNGLIASNPYPNPFSESTKIKISVPDNEASELVIEIFNDLGQQINQIKENYNIGTHFVTLERNQFPTSGLYFYHLRTKYRMASGKVIVE
jgi:hypothetical protein